MDSCKSPKALVFIPAWKETDQYHLLFSLFSVQRWSHGIESAFKCLKYRNLVGMEEEAFHTMLLYYDNSLSYKDLLKMYMSYHIYFETL